MGRREAALEEQPHRVAFPAEGRLDAHEDVAELLAKHEDPAPVGLDACPGPGPRRASIAFRCGVLRTMASAATWAATLASWP